MALVKCKSCDYVTGVGFMPQTSCGLLTSPALGVAVVAPFLAWPSLSWWSLLLPIPIFFVLVLAIHFIPWSFEYLLICWQKCPKCGKRNWSFPFTSGFGL